MNCSKWIADKESGDDRCISVRREYAQIIDDREETLARYRRNADELGGDLKRPKNLLASGANSRQIPNNHFASWIDFS